MAWWRGWIKEPSEEGEMELWRDNSRDIWRWSELRDVWDVKKWRRGWRNERMDSWTEIRKSIVPSITSSVFYKLCSHWTSHLSAHWVRDQPQKKSLPLCDIRSDSSLKTSQSNVTSSVFMRQPTLPASASRVTIRRVADREWERGGACHRFVTAVEAWSLMFRLNCYRIDVDTKVAGSENWHDHGDLARECQRSGISKCDAALYIRKTVTHNSGSVKRSREEWHYSPDSVSFILLPLLHILLLSFFSHICNHQFLFPMPSYFSSFSLTSLILWLSDFHFMASVGAQWYG